MNLANFLGDIKLTDETPVLRIWSHSQSGPETSFRDGVRARDKRCVLTGVLCRGASEGRWGTFQAAHIIPVKEEAPFNRDFSHLITTGSHTAPLDSVQNGILWDCYKITHFGDDNWGVDGNQLDEVCRKENDPNNVADELLRWHF
ncbi:HNH endonuclease signature motif containing protein [Aspergillus fischeri NRRL 181]|uniref:HNH nuclease domain-containing protein n=1 Tax=Neosartorya fischeri (strain ATCC 1020 / DSM 3700 / CBS 544.65 / FGSC A1164 / JCM 1740 / NRRL 181 / WB 181) TaxID=331117 RepID=A1DGS7_NEOFI|nr:uncharacterized protein NFIA_085370 [Aspergillus fischeri NRRL 181]EAW18584.1 hypothetical protein NFIA_085370 [Aspergillus fischeri NRRL 181]